MEYYEFVISPPDMSREAIAHKLMQMGSTGFFEREGEIVAYFDAAQDGGTITGELASFRSILELSGLDPSFSFTYRLLPETDWNETWKQGFRPIHVGERLTIIPPWESIETDRPCIIVDPGMAFGTGHHETTKTCLALVERLSESFRGKRLLDVGTGTGILAIGAVRLGFSEAVAVDIDPLAVEAARNNVSLNRVSGVKVLQGSISDVRGTFDVIAANLISGALIRIAPDIAARLRPGGIALLSGMLAGQEHEVIGAAEHTGLLLRETITDHKWVTLLFDACRAAEGV